MSTAVLSLDKDALVKSAKERNAELLAKRIPLNDKQFAVPDFKTGKLVNISAIDPHWVKEMEIIAYQPVKSDLQVEDREEILTYCCEDLELVLSLPHGCFWSHIIYDENLKLFLESYLRYSPRIYDDKPDGRLNMVEKKLYRLVFLVLLRSSTPKESKDSFLDPKVFGDIVYQNWIFDIPKIIDIATLYGEGNQDLLYKMFNNLFDKNGQYWNDLEDSCVHILEALNSVLTMCTEAGEKEKAAVVDRKGKGKGKAVEPKQEKALHSQIEAMTPREVIDLQTYIIDFCHSIISFCKCFPPSALILTDLGVIQTLPNVYEKLTMQLDQFLIVQKAVTASGITQSSSTSQKLAKIKENDEELRYLLLSLFNILCANCFFEPPMDKLPKLPPMELFQDTLSQSLSCLAFVKDFGQTFPLRQYVEKMWNSLKHVDESEKDYLEMVLLDTIGEEFALSASEQTAPTEKSNVDPTTQVDDGELKLVSAISAVKDLFPELGDGFVEKCLQYYRGNVEQTINSVLEGNLPSELRDLDRNMAREKSAGKNKLFDGIEELGIDISQVEIGKKRQPKDALKLLEDKSFVSEVKETFLYEYEDDEEEDLYNDEYDDTFDGAGLYTAGVDADSSEELNDAKPSHTNVNTKGVSNSTNGTSTKKKYDVVGQGKGQGQTHQVLRNRLIKDRMKASKANHNRKKRAGQKQMKGMSFVTPS
eukprot:Nk52_evm40s2657 gene=Nk52_evmTU40s2657